LISGLRPPQIFGQQAKGTPPGFQTGLYQTENLGFVRRENPVLNFRGVALGLRASSPGKRTARVYVERLATPREFRVRHGAGKSRMAAIETGNITVDNPVPVAQFDPSCQ